MDFRIVSVLPNNDATSGWSICLPVDEALTFTDWLDEHSIAYLYSSFFDDVEEIKYKLHKGGYLIQSEGR